MKDIFVRIVKSNECDNCKIYIPRLQKQGFSFEIYDGDAPDNQKSLDAWHINEFPVVQIVSKDVNGVLMIEHQFPPGHMPAPRIINFKKEQITNIHK